MCMVIMSYISEINHIIPDDSPLGVELKTEAFDKPEDRSGLARFGLARKGRMKPNDEIQQKGIMNIYSCSVISMIIPLFAFSLGIYHISAWAYCLNIE